MSDISRVVALCNLLVEQEAAVESAEAILKQHKAAALRTKREDIPTLMQEVGIDAIRLEDGTEVSVKEDCDARISEVNRDAAHAWLADHGFGGLIKTKVVVEFGRGEHVAAVACANTLREENDNVQLDEVVHPATLKAFVREQLAAGAAIPADLFGISPYSYAKITMKRH